MKAQKLHNFQVVIETNGKLDYIDIDSENTEITDDLFNFIQRLVDRNSLILSITRIN